jgi:ankyrin repeat protein
MSLPPPLSGGATSWIPQPPRPGRWPRIPTTAWTALHLAAFFGQLEAATRLLEAARRLTAVSRNPLANTPLHAAVAGGHSDVSVLLIARGADVNAIDSGATRRCTSRQKTVSSRSSKRCWLTAPIHTPSSVEDKTPLSRAAAGNHAAVVDAMNLKG